MSSNLRDPKAANPKDQENPGLDPDELRAEQAGDLPERDAMSIIGVGGLEGGLPPAGFLDGILGTDPPDETLPVDGLPVEQYPVDQLPIHLEPPVITPPVIVPPIIPPGGDGAIDPPVGGDPIDVPDPLDASIDV